MRVDGGYLDAVSEGTAVVTAAVNGFANYTDSVKVTVKRSTAAVISATADAGTPLSFSTLRSQFRDRSSTVLGESLSYLSGLSVPTDQGTLYYRYTSADDTGAVVWTSERYYLSPDSGQLGFRMSPSFPRGIPVAPRSSPTPVTPRDPAFLGHCGCRCGGGSGYYASGCQWRGRAVQRR
ncbi:MAG: hypothetical protein V8R55_08895 [Dysosmobacter sp.]